MSTTTDVSATVAASPPKDHLPPSARSLSVSAVVTPLSPAPELCLLDIGVTGLDDGGPLGDEEVWKSEATLLILLRGRLTVVPVVAGARGSSVISKLC